jgi:uncharacterized protein
MKKSIVFVLSLLMWSVCTGPLQAQVPERPSVQRLVNDFSGVFAAHEIHELERKLVAFDNASGSQVCVVTVPDLEGEEISMAAYRILSEWGIGSAKNNNGVVVLLEHKPGDASGRVAISVGYGLEGVLTDALSKRIISDHMIPHFKNGAYFQGVQEGLSKIMAAAEEEYSATAADEDITTAAIVFVAGFISLLVFLLIIVIANKRKGPTNLGGNNKKGPGMLELMILANLLGGGNRGSRSGGSSGGFGSGGGFGGGGFGGFGGGTGGGGGASGSW